MSKAAVGVVAQWCSRLPGGTTAEGEGLPRQSSGGLDCPASIAEGRDAQWTEWWECWWVSCVVVMATRQGSRSPVCTAVGVSA